MAAFWLRSVNRRGVLAMILSRFRLARFSDGSPMILGPQRLVIIKRNARRLPRSRTLAETNHPRFTQWRTSTCTHLIATIDTASIDGSIPNDWNARFCRRESCAVLASRYHDRRGAKPVFVAVIEERPIPRGGSIRVAGGYDALPDPQRRRG